MPTDGYADVNGVRLHYVAEGEGDLILFLHGFPEFWYAWKEQLAASVRRGRPRELGGGHVCGKNNLGVSFRAGH